MFLLVDGVSTIQFSRVERGFGVPGAVWPLIFGILEIVLAIFLGVLMAANPGEVLESFVWVGGLLSLIAGIFVLVAAYRVRKAVVI